MRLILTLILTAAAWAQPSIGILYPAMNPKIDAVIAVLWSNPVAREDGLQLLVNQASNGTNMLTLTWDGSGIGDAQGGATVFAASMKRDYPKGLTWNWPNGDPLLVFDPACSAFAYRLYDAQSLIVEVRCDGSAKLYKTNRYRPDATSTAFWNAVAGKYKRNPTQRLPQGATAGGFAMLAVPDWDAPQDRKESDGADWAKYFGVARN